MKLHQAGLVGLAGALAAVGIAAPSLAGGNKYDASETERVCTDSGGSRVGTVTLVGPLTLWPPNHKLVDEPVTVTDDSGDGVTVTLYPTVDDTSGGDGGSNHDPDWRMAGGEDAFYAAGDGTATAAMQYRAERSGKGDGRTYTMNWTATFDDGAVTCTSDDTTAFVIEVPHDMRGGAGWKK